MTRDILVTRVWEHLKNGRRRRRVLKREHVCTKRCLRRTTMFGLTFSWCAKYSYRLEGE